MQYIYSQSLFLISGFQFYELFASMSSADSESGAELPNLPDEIWSKVFSYLPIDDRKNIRLSCHRLYRAASTFAAQKSEKMVFYGNSAVLNRTRIAITNEKYGISNSIKWACMATLFLHFYRKMALIFSL